MPAPVRNWTNVPAIRAKALYSEDEAKTLRKSHENPENNQKYEEFLGKPNSHKAHMLLHTTYEQRDIYLSVPAHFAAAGTPPPPRLYVRT